MKIEKILGLDSYDYIYSAGYRYRDIKFCLKSTTVSPVKWCNIYFNGYYDIVDNFFQCDYTINYIVSKKMYRVAEKALDFSNVAQIKSHHYRFAFKFALEGLDDFILFYPNFKFYIIYNLSKKTFYIISDGTEDDNRFEPARMIREITTRELEKQGYFVMHAAALEKNGKTIILTGKKGSGKSTNFLGLVEEGFNIIANDRVFIGIENGKLNILGWPGAVALTIGTANKFPKTASCLPNIGKLVFPQMRLSKDIDLSNPKVIENHLNDNVNKIDFTPTEIADLFKVKIVKSNYLNQIIWLENIKRYTHSINNLTNFELKELFKESVLYPVDPSYPDWFNMREENISKIDKLYQDLFNGFINLAQAKKFIGIRNISEDLLYLKKYLLDVVGESDEDKL